MKIVFATGNPHKLKELKEIAGDCGIDFILPPDGFDPVENGKTFEENSLIKAREAAKLSGEVSLADDSGLCVDALNGEPGIYSARYAETPQKRIDKLLENLRHCEEHLKNVTSQSHNNEITTHSLNARNDMTDNRRAKFVCSMSLVKSNGDIIFQTIGECHGHIATKQAGTNGFGYDPIFIPDGYTSTIAELSEEEKNLISHRGNALRKVLEYIRNN